MSNETNSSSSNSSRNTTTTTSSSSVSVSRITSNAIVALVILVGNVICLVVYLKTRRMRKKPYYLLVSLSVADLLVGVGILEAISLELTANAGTGRLVRSSTLYYLASPASLFMLTSIAIERFIVTVFPLYFHRHNGGGLYFALIGVPWLVASVILIIYILSYKVAILPTYLITYSRATIAGCLATIIIAYTALVLKYKCCPAIQRQQTSNQMLRDRKLAVTLTIVTVISLTTWSPYGIYITVLYYCNCISPNSSNILFALNWFRYLNSGINVAVYMFRMPEFKRAALQLCKRNSIGAEPSTRSRGTSDEQSL